MKYACVHSIFTISNKTVYVIVYLVPNTVISVTQTVLQSVTLLDVLPTSSTVAQTNCVSVGAKTFD